MPLHEEKFLCIRKTDDRMPRHLTEQALCPIPALGAGLFQAVLPSTAHPEAWVAQGFRRDFPKVTPAS